jgi:ketosteroid isomerase-like protein
MQEREKVELFERVVVAWNRGDLDAVLAECTPDFEFDLTRSDIPGLSEVFRGRDGYLKFATSWRETMGPTRLELVESEELDDGRLFVVVRQKATGPRSGVEVENPFAQILEFDGDKANRGELFGVAEEGRAAAGLPA